MSDKPPSPRDGMPDVDLEMLAAVLDGDPNASEGGYLDLTTGETWPAFAFDEDDDFDAEDARWRYVPCLGSRGAWQDMRDFVDTQVPDPALADRLSDAITGRGSFHRFNAVLRGHDEIRYSWLHFKDERARARARLWVTEQGLHGSSGRV